MSTPPVLTPTLAQLEIAVEGEGISPNEISIRHLAELLEASAATIDALAAESQRPSTVPSLRAILIGSAAYVLESDKVVWPPLVAQFHEAVRSRGSGHSDKVRAGLGRLFRAGKIGSVRVRALGLLDERYAKPVHLAAPLEAASLDIAHATVVYGKIVGVNEFDHGSTVKLELADGGRQEFQAESLLAIRAAKLFGKKIRATVTAVWDSSKNRDWALESFDSWADDDLLDAIDKVRADLAAKGVTIDPDAWMREID
jgi:hypothetical protein